MPPGVKQSSESQPFVLVVDDDRFTRMMLCNTLEALGYLAVEACNGKEALNIIEQSWMQLDGILLDRAMPEMGGMEVVAQIKKNPELSWLPIIMQTGANRREEILEGVEAGVFYYLTKPIDVEVLKSVITVASREARRRRQLLRELAERKTTLQMIESCKCVLRTLPEAEITAGWLANCFPDPKRVISGLAELLYNAVEHGNLGVTYDEKTALIALGTWSEEVALRAKKPENTDKRVEALFQRSREGCSVTIKDQGKGFAWRNYLQLDPARAGDNHGHGIAQAKLVSFDLLTYNEAGNEVTALCWAPAKP
jgi:two-component system, cell cycle response regulator